MGIMKIWFDGNARLRMTQLIKSEKVVEMEIPDAGGLGMKDEELLALAAIVNHETFFMDAVNKMRERQGYALAYVDPSDNYFKLLAEIERRALGGGE